MAKPSPPAKPAGTAEVVLDGYNLLLRDGRGWEEPARDELVREAARYRGESQVQVTVVFDARSGAGTASATRFAGVRVVFAAGDADAAILDIVRRSRQPRDILVVTSDRQLAAHARDLGARCEGAEEFRARGAARRGKSRGRGRAGGGGGGRAGTGSGRTRAGDEPERPLSAAEVAEWMRKFEARRGEDD